VAYFKELSLKLGQENLSPFAIPTWYLQNAVIRLTSIATGWPCL